MIIAVFVILLLFSAFFSGSETAFLSLGKVRFKQLEDSDSVSAKRAVSLLSNPHKLIITILIGNTLVNIAASSIMTSIFYGAWGEKGVGASVIVMMVLVLIFGEVTPKMFAFYNARRYSMFASLPVAVFEKIFMPLQYLLDAITRNIAKWTGLSIQTKRPPVTEQDLMELFSIGEQKGIVKEREKDMVYNVLRLNDLNAADIMTPRIDIEALDITASREALVAKIIEDQYSRFPVYVHDIDNIVGILHSKDFLLNADKPMKELVKKMYFVPESIRVDNLLSELQKQKMHMAVVTDEYGVTSGLVTIEDILEVIVGEIRDELDMEKPKVRKIGKKYFEVDGQAHINEINRKLGLGIETTEVDTIGGYVILKLGRIPQSGDIWESDKFTIEVGDVSKNRITSVRVRKK